MEAESAARGWVRRGLRPNDLTIGYKRHGAAAPLARGLFAAGVAPNAVLGWWRADMVVDLVMASIIAREGCEGLHAGAS